MKSITVFIHKCDIHGKLVHIYKQFKIMYSAIQHLLHTYIAHNILPTKTFNKSTIMLQGSDLTQTAQPPVTVYSNNTITGYRLSGLVRVQPGKLFKK
jgi:Na+/H+ antiporter NhaA